jgi:hypothetical protein
MKTMRIVLVATVIALTLANLTAVAQVIQEKPKFQVAISMTLERAIHNPGLVRAIYQQVHKEDVIGAHLHVYVASVNYEGKVYLISGTLDEWMLFFLMDGGGTATNTMKYRGGGGIDL